MGTLLRVTGAGMAERGRVQPQLDPAASQELGSALSEDGPREPKACAGSTVGEVRAFPRLCLLPHAALMAQPEMHPEDPPGPKASRAVEKWVTRAAMDLKPMLSAGCLSCHRG